MSPRKGQKGAGPIRAYKHRHPKKQAFLMHYAVMGNVTYAAAKAEIARTQVYEWIKKDDKFAALMQKAGEESVEIMEMEAKRRAMKGVTKPVYYKGEKVGEVQEYSDTLMIFLLKAANPKKYRDNHKLEVEGLGGGQDKTADKDIKEAQEVIDIIEVLSETGQVPPAILERIQAEDE